MNTQFGDSLDPGDEAVDVDCFRHPQEASQMKHCFHLPLNCGTSFRQRRRTAVWKVVRHTKTPGREGKNSSIPRQKSELIRVGAALAIAARISSISGSS